MMKKYSMLLMVFVLAVFTAACGMVGEDTGSKNSEKGTSSDTIKIGLVLAGTGPSSTLGKAQVNTAKMIQEQLDAGGSVNGKKIELVVQDYETDDTKAVIAMDRLIEQGVVGIVGATQSSTSMAIIPKAVAAGLPVMATAPINTDQPNIYAMAQATPSIAQVIIDYLLENKITKVAWVNARDGFGVDGLPAFEPLAKENGIVIVAHEEFDATASDMTIQLTNVRSKKPEAIIVWSRTPGAGLVARNFKALGMDIPMIQSTAAANDGFLEQVKGDSSNLFVVGSRLSVVDQLEDSKQKTMLVDFRNSYKKKYNEEPDLFAAHAVDGINMYLSAIEAGKFTSKDIVDFFNNEMGEFPGVSGTIVPAKPMGGAGADGLHLLQIEDGKWVYKK